MKGRSLGGRRGWRSQDDRPRHRGFTPKSTGDPANPWAPIARSCAASARIGYGLSSAAVPRDRRGFADELRDARALAFGRFSNQVHSLAGEADRGACHGHGEELAKRPSTDWPLAPMLAPATARMLPSGGEELPNKGSPLLALLALARVLSGAAGGGRPDGGLPPASHDAPGIQI